MILRVSIRFSARGAVEGVLHLHDLWETEMI